MPRKQTVEIVPILQQALEAKTVDDLKKLCPLLSLDQKLTRKADLITAILQQIEGAKIKKFWQQLDELQKAAVAEVVHSSGNNYNADAFVEQAIAILIVQNISHHY
jgi:predicted CoA-binding protein